MKQSAARAKAQDAGYSLTGRDKRLVATSLARLTPASSLVAELFRRRAATMNGRLLEVIGPLDPAAVTQWALMLRAALTTKDRNVALSALARLMGTQARSHGLRPEDCVTCAAALFWTLERSLREDFTPELRHAWGMFVIEMTKLMIGDSVSGSVSAPKKSCAKQHEALDEAVLI